MDKFSESISNLGKRKTIKNKVVLSTFNGHKEDINSFFDDFVKPRLVKKEIAAKWHYMLMKYVDMEDNTLYIRNGGTSKKLRRGWLTKYINKENGKTFNVVFSDNDLGCIIYKMALDEFVPSVDEFYEFSTSFKYRKDLEWYSKNKGLEREFDEKHGERKFFKLPVHFVQYGGINYPDKYEGGKKCCYFIRHKLCSWKNRIQALTYF